MERKHCLIDYYLPPPEEGFVLESLVATTYQVDFECLEEELLAFALGVRSRVQRGFRSELERKLQKVDASVLYDLGGCVKLARCSPRIDAVPITSRKLHSKISLPMWVRENRADGAPADRRMRLIVGSANLTPQGFRNNYECVMAADFGGRNKSPRSLLTSAVALVKEIGKDSQSQQLQNQLKAFAEQAALLPDGTAGPDDPIALVDATAAVPAICEAWTALSNKAPETITVVSPFWPAGDSASEALSDLFQKLGSPANVELVCRGEMSANGKKWLPVFDKAVAVDLKNLLSCRLFLRAALPDTERQQSGPTYDAGNELEEEEFATKLGTANNKEAEIRRALHAKMILLDGTAGSVLYIGSSNCTRHGLGLGGPTNFEAGVVYRLTPRQRKQASGLLAFAGPAIEVRADVAPSTVPSPADEEPFVPPRFLSEIVALGTVVTVRFRETIPADLVLLMPVPAKAGDAGCYWLLYRAEAQSQLSAQAASVDLAGCQRCDDRLAPLPADPSGQQLWPNVYVQVRWKGNSAEFPVRFDDKARLPPLLFGRKPTEAELIDYFLFGKEPDEGEEVSGLPGEDFEGPATDAPIDTRRILAYFIRRFVQAIPGIEAEVRRAGYSRASLDAALRGPMSPLELANRAYASLTQPARRDEPVKTPTAVGFQLTEILAALLRCQSLVTDAELLECFHPVIAPCRKMLDGLASTEAELQAAGFRLYQKRVLGDAK